MTKRSSTIKLTFVIFQEIGDYSKCPGPEHRAGAQDDDESE